MTQSVYGGHPAQTQQKTNTLAIVGFVLSFLVSLAGVVCCAVALSQISERGERGRGLAVAGIIIGVLAMALSAAYWLR